MRTSHYTNNLSSIVTSLFLEPAFTAAIKSSIVVISFGSVASFQCAVNSVSFNRSSLVTQMLSIFGSVLFGLVHPTNSYPFFSGGYRTCPNDPRLSNVYVAVSDYIVICFWKVTAIEIVCNIILLI